MSEPTANLLWGPVANLRALLAASATFQVLVGAGTPEDAAEAIFSPSLGDTDYRQARPFAVIGIGSDRSARRASSTDFDDRGTLVLALEADVPAEHRGPTAEKHEAAEKWFLSLCGDILAEMMAAAVTAGYLAMTGWRQLLPPQRADLEIQADEGDFYQVIFEIQWGTD